MCGEIQEWQIARSVCIRLITNGNKQLVTLGSKFDDVEEIRLDEIMVTNFNGGVSAAAYVKLYQNGMNEATCNNEQEPGLLIGIDVLNPHTVYQRPRVISVGNMVNINSFNVEMRLPGGAVATFNEAVLILTFVCRRSPDSIAEVRRLKATVDYLPSIIDVRNTFDPTK